MSTCAILSRSRWDKRVARFSSISGSQKQALAIATALAIIFGAYFLRHYFTLIIFAAILAFLFNPFYQKQLAKNKNEGRSAALTFLFALAVILIPLTVLFTLTTLQINHTINELDQKVSSVNVTETSQHIIDSVNSVIAKTPSDFRVSPEWIQSTLSGLAQKIGTSFLSNLGSYAGNFFSFFTTAIIFIFVFLSLLKNQITLQDTFRSLNPLGEKISDLYSARISAMTKAMVKGQFIIAAAQGTTDALLIYLGGMHEAFFFLLMILIALSFIPLGGGILAIPIGILMALTGNVAGGVLVVAGHLLIVTNIDNILRPRLVPAEAKLDSALTILSVFSGIALLGFLGIVVGPVIMITIVTTISVYLEVYRGIDMEEAAVTGKKSKHFWQKIPGIKA